MSKTGMSFVEWDDGEEPVDLHDFYTADEDNAIIQDAGPILVAYDYDNRLIGVQEKETMRTWFMEIHYAWEQFYRLAKNFFALERELEKQRKQKRRKQRNVG